MLQVKFDIRAYIVCENLDRVRKEHTIFMNWMSKMERKFGKYAIPNLMRYVAILYAVGAILQMVKPELLYMLQMDFGAVLQGQVWRLVTFIIDPPSDSLLLNALSIYVYYTMGNALEHRWGTFAFNLYYALGVLSHILAGVLVYFLFDGGYYLLPVGTLGTYYLNLSLFFAFVTEFSEVQFLLFFIIPIKAKWLGIIDAIYFAATIIGGLLFPVLPQVSLFLLSLNVGIFAVPDIAILALISALNYILFYQLFRKRLRMTRQQKQIRKEFRAKVAEAKAIQRANAGAPRHCCTICGRTEQTNPELEFRYCSKCEGSFEYCEDHLYTHQHVKK